MLTKEQVEERNKKILSGWEHIWAQNTARNYTFAVESGKLDLKDTNIRNLQNRHKGTPALITGSGYSLKKTLKKLGGNFPGIVISTNSNMSACMANGLRPDYVHIFDGKIKPERIKGIPIDGIPMIGCTSMHPDMLKHWVKHGPVYLFNMFDPNSPFFTRTVWYLFQFDAVPTSGSVAPNAIRLAAYMGCNPIVFAGMDFAFTEGMYRVPRYEFKLGRWRERPDNVQISINQQPICYENGQPTWKITGILYKTALVNIVNQIHKEGFNYVRLEEGPDSVQHVLRGKNMEDTKGVDFINLTEGGIWKGEIPEMTVEAFLEKHGSERTKDG